MERLWNKESNETKTKWFVLTIREKSFFENQQNSLIKFGGNDEFFYF